MCEVLSAREAHERLDAQIFTKAGQYTPLPDTYPQVPTPRRKADFSTDHTVQINKLLGTVRPLVSQGMVGALARPRFSEAN